MHWKHIIHGDPAQAPAPAFRPGDEVRVWYRILEQGKERLGQFEGLVIRFRGSRFSKTFTVRRVTYGEGVERVFPVDSKTVARVEVLRLGKVKRSRLYFLRRTIGKTRIAAAEGSGAGAPPTTSGKAGDAATEQAEGAVSSTNPPASLASPRA